MLFDPPIGDLPDEETSQSEEEVKMKPESKEDEETDEDNPDDIDIMWNETNTEDLLEALRRREEQITEQEEEAIKEEIQILSSSSSTESEDQTLEDIEEQLNRLIQWKSEETDPEARLLFNDSIQSLLELRDKHQDNHPKSREAKMNPEIQEEQPDDEDKNRLFPEDPYERWHKNYCKMLQWRDEEQDPAKKRQYDGPLEQMKITGERLQQKQEIDWP